MYKIVAVHYSGDETTRKERLAPRQTSNKEDRRKKAESEMIVKVECHHGNKVSKDSTMHSIGIIRIMSEKARDSLETMISKNFNNTHNSVRGNVSRRDMPRIFQRGVSRKCKSKAFSITNRRDTRRSVSLK